MAAAAVALGTEKGRGRGKSEILSQLDEQTLILVVGCVVCKRAARFVEMSIALRLCAVGGAAAKADKARTAGACIIGLRTPSTLGGDPHPVSPMEVAAVDSFTGYSSGRCRVGRGRLGSRFLLSLWSSPLAATAAASSRTGGVGALSSTLRT
jgi:hypothetical protein